MFQTGTLLCRVCVIFPRPRGSLQVLSSSKDARLGLGMRTIGHSQLRMGVNVRAVVCFSVSVLC